MKKINVGHTNKSYKQDNFFYQEKVKNGLNHMSNYLELRYFDFVPKLIEDTPNYSKWEWIDGSSLDDPSDEDLKKLVSILKQLHNSKIRLTKNNIRRRITEYRKIIKDKNIQIDIINKLYTKVNSILRNIDTSIPVHGDLYRTNIIKRKKDNKIFIVDWEYSHMGDIHYELAYIIEAYEFNKEKEKIFLSYYQDYDLKILNDHKILVNYITILWLYSQDKIPFSPEKIIKKLTIQYEQLIK